MKVYLTRHGLTAGNTAKQYIGAGTDIPLSPQGIEQLEQQDKRTAERVYTSGMLRTRQTADIIYPASRQIELAGLREMHFGIFEGKSWQQLQHDKAYTEWLDGFCIGQCPGGESREQFIDRTAAAFTFATRAETTGELHMVVHGGTIMAVMNRFAGREYFSSTTKPGGCWVCELHGLTGNPWLEVLQQPEESP